LGYDRRTGGADHWDDSAASGFHPTERGRIFAQGVLRFFILRLIAEQPRHGYEIIKVIGERVGGVYTPSAGAIYPILNLLEEQGLIRQAGTDGAKKLYDITAEGVTELHEKRDVIDGMFARIAQVREQMNAGRPPQIVRAVENLRTALRLRMERGDLDAARIDAIADALDATARTIEKI
jgi:DNA-binding PadR family transcriptional regulator